MKPYKFRQGIHLLADIKPDNGKHADAGDEKLMFALVSLDAYGATLGFRFFRIRTEETEGIDDFFDRAALGITICHGQLILEVLFIRITFS